MAKQSFLDKLQLAPPASFHVLDPAKAKRMNATTLYIPGPAEVARAINAIPRGQTRTIIDLRQALAREGDAETACPAATLKYWKWMAQVSEELGGKTSPYAIPWWRVLKDGKPSRHMPGGVERHIAMLTREGVKI